MARESGKNAYVLRPAQRRYMAVKRALDIMLSLVLLILLAAPMLLVVLAQKVSCPGEPALFHQVRVGRHETPFTLVKFRTMRTGAGERAGEDSPLPEGETTRLGWFLRAASVDELPQLFQVLSGRMSLIGPRPLIPQEEGVHALRRAAGVYQLRPGLTGWAQINGRDLLDDGTKAAYDREYLEKLSFAMDWRIFWRTIGKVVRREDIREKQ